MFGSISQYLPQYKGAEAAEQPPMDPVTELANLKFLPRQSAWKHVQRFERLVMLAYPKATDAGKWSLFVKTIDSSTNNVWRRETQQTPSQWLMELNEKWHRENPPCEDPTCDDCKNDAMSYDPELKDAFLMRFEDNPRDRERDLRRSHTSASRSLSMPPGSDIGSDIDGPVGSGALVPHSRSSAHLPPAAPTPPNELANDRDTVVQETKTNISINAAEGAGQIVLQISNNRHKHKRRKSPNGADSRRLEDSPTPSSRPSTPPGRLTEHSNRSHDHLDRDARDRDGRLLDRDSRDFDRDDRERRQIEPPPTQVVQLVDADRHRPSTPPYTPSRDRDSLTGTPPPPPLRPRLLEGKVAAITGASRGIGRAIALGFAREGCSIVAHYWGTKSDPANEEIVSLCVEIRNLGQGCSIVFGDISDPRTSESIIRRAIEGFGRLDIAVGNAGMCWFREFLDVPPELLRRHVDVNLNGNFYFVQAAARQFRRQFHEDESRGVGGLDYSILCVSATGTNAKSQAHFSPTAAGIKSLMESTAVGLGPYGVRCNTLSVGVVQTGMVREELMDMELRGRMEKRVPLGRLGVPGDVVGPAVWLAGEMGRWVTGAEIKVDGGMSCSGGV